jgi:hypothetical protein
MKMKSYRPNLSTDRLRSGFRCYEGGHCPSAPGALGNPGLRPDGTVKGRSSPVPASPSTPAPTQMARPTGYDPKLEAAYRRLDDRLPRGVSVAEQARAADGNFGRNHTG